jgi:hypothetical protein
VLQIKSATICVCEAIRFIRVPFLNTKVTKDFKDFSDYSNLCCK